MHDSERSLPNLCSLGLFECTVKEAGSEAIERSQSKCVVHQLVMNSMIMAPCCLSDARLEHHVYAGSGWMHVCNNISSVTQDPKLRCIAVASQPKCGMSATYLGKMYPLAVA